MIQREDFLKLSTLKQVAILEFLRTMGVENLKRVAQIVDRLLSPVHMMAEDITRKDLTYYKQLEELTSEIHSKRLNLNGAANLLKEVFLLQRSANDSLEELFLLANLEDLVEEEVDDNVFRLEESNQFYGPLRKLVDQIMEAQTIIPIETISVKSLLTQIVLAEYQSKPRFDFSYFIRTAVNLFKFLQTNHKTIGLFGRGPSTQPIEEMIEI